MASYASYKKVSGESVVDGTVTDAKISSSAFKNYCVKWIRGCLGAETPGCCCLWTVPTGVRRVTFELWGAGGNGHGLCVNNRCQHYAGAQGGYYNSKTIQVADGCQYTVCAAGVHPCQSVECYACHGCSTYVNGFGLSNFCALGGKGGCANDNWNTACHSDWGICCAAPGAMGGDFGIGNHRGAFFVHVSECHCHCQGASPTAAPFIGTQIHAGMQECWMRCGCAISPYGHGGQGAMTTYCGGSNCCGRGNTGGPGLVKISFL